ncbi:hypothetical protein N7532_004118 [Penicillium argentinense]|uniref:Uncharacterized protein n=1 Tax=Penicillium argentinense TaxID=1131581 RepID=A0A9W9KEL7_9EURO|nr:uncharacterized protein N7532_004118 [Penicillium argentinense]KAJ5103589.1 hypothetical protein N7532_004118 [Penicillium argentinense]
MAGLVSGSDEKEADAGLEHERGRAIEEYRKDAEGGWPLAASMVPSRVTCSCGPHMFHARVSLSPEESRRIYMERRRYTARR